MNAVQFRNTQMLTGCCQIAHHARQTPVCKLLSHEHNLS